MSHAVLKKTNNSSTNSSLHAVSAHRKNTEACSHAENSRTLRSTVEQSLHNYFTNLDGSEPSDLLKMVMTEVETPLLQVVLQYTRGNQSKAAEYLGINRATLRKKLQTYDLI